MAKYDLEQRFDATLADPTEGSNVYSVRKIR
jgi:hypothetical protein